ncbi:V-set domain-containing T-cell activation inhibitor 1 [Heterocephalus glaber]|uniref:V-set domain-containing T-cell activation inhibitor 1 n=1 Tax=Heterocephalus glaber TaxID=10181 RepID=G5AU92_HETGA|nr:V-set domain-containing T-cell activation inhibitor 1 [Heterocephalus glaber]
MFFFLLSANLLLLLHGEVSVWEEELRAHPFTDVTLSCHFSFVEGTENLEFSWEREDIREEYEVDDDEQFYRFFRYYDFFEVFTKLVYQFGNNTEQLEDQNAMYEGRVSVDRNEISEGSLSLLLRNVNFMDEAMYKCSAITPDGRGESTMKLIVEDSEMPQVQFDKIGEEDVATCISKGWYFAPNVTWLDRGERDLSNHSTVEVLEEQMNGLYRVYSVLKYPVKLNEKYVCHIKETDQNYKPFRIIRRYPSKCKPEGKSENGCISPQRSQHSLIFTECQVYQALLGTLGT